jgi:hypothetical protein
MNSKGIGGGHRGAWSYPYLSGWQQAVQVKADNCVYPFKYPGLYHWQGARDNFFCGLKSKAYLSRELLFEASKNRRHMGCNGCVSVVTTCVHDPRKLGSVFNPRGFVNGQGINVGPHQHRFAGFSPFKSGYQASLGNSPSNLKPQFLQELGQLSTGTHFLKSQLGVAVEVSAHL